MAIPAGLQQQLIANQINQGSPGWTIVNNANLGAPPPGARAGLLTITPPNQILLKLMNAFYSYGRTHFSWISASPPTAGNGGLLKGHAHSCACASFNYNLKKLAEICGVQGIQHQRHTSHFITIPGGAAIDQNWGGNVRSLTESFQDFNAFKFSSHYWLSYQGQHYDVCFNTTFAGATDFIWMELQLDEKLRTKVGINPGGLFKLKTPLPGYEYAIMVQANGTGGWPMWQLVSKAQLLKMR